MNQKITLPALASIISRRSGLSKRVCEEFVRELFEIITESLRGGDSVKIQDLGIFRLSVVEPRMSVDVSTGQPIEIAGHKKVVFLPDRSLAASINAPFEAFEPVELSDDLDETTLALLEEVEELPDELQVVERPDDNSDDDSAAEDSATEDSIAEDITAEDSATEDSTAEDITADDENLYFLPEDGEPEQKTDSTRKNEDVLKGDEESNPEEDPAYMVDPFQSTEKEPQILLDPESQPAPHTQPEPHIQPALHIRPKPHIQSASHSQQEHEADGPQLDPPQKRFRFGWGFIVGFASCLLLIVLGAICFRLFSSDSQPEAEPVAEVMDIESIVVADSILQTDSVIAADSVLTENKDSISAPAPDSDAENVRTAHAVKADTQPSDKVVYDTITRTRYLTTMAKQHYGDYNLWPYIYEENKSFLGHPDRIRPGTPVVIPRLSKYGVDPRNPADIEKAKKMGYAIYARYNKPAARASHTSSGASGVKKKATSTKTKR